jgi:hypothetical protein
MSGMAAFERKKRPARARKVAPDDTSPLDDAEYTDNPERDSEIEITLTLEALQNKERKRALRHKLRLTTDSEYWCALCFETREQADAFAAAVGGKAGDKYVDGVALARRLGVDLPVSDMTYRPTARPNNRLLSLVRRA